VLCLLSLALLVSQPVSTPTREVAPLSDKARSLVAFGAKLGAKGGRIEHEEHLASFFQALDELSFHTRKDNVRIITFGNSLISADNVTNVVRERLVERFGDGGRGLVLTDRIADYGPRTRSGIAPKGMWASYNLAMGPRGRGIFGLSGVFHEATTYAASEWKLAGETEGELFYLDHRDARPFSLKVDGAPLLSVEPKQDGLAHSVRFSVPDNAKKLQLTAARGNTTIFGVSLERSRPGIVFDTIGIPAAEASSYLTARADIADAQLRARQPTLLVFMLGGNEIRRLSWTRSTSVEKKKTQLADDFRTFVSRMQASAPGAACLAVGPIDAVFGASSAQKLKTRPQVDDLNQIERRIAEERGCAFFDLFAAMGGKGSLEKFHMNDMLHEDLVHPKGKGLDLLGELISMALLSAYTGQPQSQLARH
jgi:lysophospholipase L1-like esterase